MSGRINCQGYCWVMKAGVITWKCDQTLCPFWGHFFAQDSPKLDECLS